MIFISIFYNLLGLAICIDQFNNKIIDDNILIAGINILFISIIIIIYHFETNNK